jgi:hypothetical protein
MPEFVPREGLVKSLSGFYEDPPKRHVHIEAIKLAWFATLEITPITAKIAWLREHLSARAFGGLVQDCRFLIEDCGGEGMTMSMHSRPPVDEDDEAVFIKGEFWVRLSKEKCSGNSQ